MRKVKKWVRLINSVARSTLSSLPKGGAFNFSGAKFKIALIPALINLLVISSAAEDGTAIMAMSIFSLFTTEAISWKAVYLYACGILADFLKVAIKYYHYI